VSKTRRLALAHLEEFFRLLPARADSDHRWTVPIAAIKERNYDLKAVNPGARADGDARTPEELLDLIEAQGREVAQALTALRGLGGKSGR
jgi:type I restriction enzyme M protein